MPDGSVRDHLHRAFCAAVPAAYRDGPPDGRRIFRDLREVRQPLTLQARSSYLTEGSWRGWFVEGRIQTQAGDEGDRVGEASTAVEQFERCIGAISDGYYLPLWVPASH